MMNTFLILLLVHQKCIVPNYVVHTKKIDDVHFVMGRFAAYLFSSSSSLSDPTFVIEIKQTDLDTCCTHHRSGLRSQYCGVPECRRAFPSRRRRRLLLRVADSGEAIGKRCASARRVKREIPTTTGRATSKRNSNRSRKR